jgi:general stress protein YciG
MKRKNPHAVALGRKGGQIGGAVRSAIKTLAARENGKKGGRPRTAVSSRGKRGE